MQGGLHDKLSNREVEIEIGRPAGIETNRQSKYVFYM